MNGEYEHGRYDVRFVRGKWMNRVGCGRWYDDYDEPDV